jgi:hypothetical protein
MWAPPLDFPTALKWDVRSEILEVVYGPFTLRRMLLPLRLDTVSLQRELNYTVRTAHAEIARSYLSTQASRGSSTIQIIVTYPLWDSSELQG